MTAITSEDDLRALYGHPKGRAKDKVLPRLEPHSRHFIGHSPFCLMATYGADGMGDVSPRGGAPGFFNGLVDELRVSDTALSPDQFLLADTPSIPVPATVLVFGFSLSILGLLAARKKSRTL